MQVMQYKQLFVKEAGSKLKEIEDYLIQTEKAQNRAAHVEKILLSLHSLKGYAATMNFLKLANAVHETEEFFIAVKNGSEKFTNELLDQLFILVDTMRSDLAAIEKSGIENDLTGATAFLFRKKTSKKTAESSEQSQPVQQETATYEPLRSFVETSTHDLGHALEQVNDAIARNQHTQRQLHRNDIGSVYLALHDSLSILSNLRQNIVRMKMMPVRQYFAYLARLVRDKSREGRKFITFNFEDNNIRLEQPILESVNELCVHLVRNALEHGFNESDRGSISIIFEVKSQMLTITVKDTGRGIPWDALIERARERGKLQKTKKVAVTQQLKEELLFGMSLSSTTQATLGSGRGLGLEVVRSKVASLQGGISFTSVATGSGHGTSFIVTIPLQPTMFQAVTWRWGSYSLALPLFVIEKIIQLPTEESRHSGRYLYQKQQLPMVDFQTFLKLGTADDGAHFGSVAILVEAGEKVALCLPARLHQEELIIDSIPVLENNPAVSGVAVSATSIPVVVINHRIFFKQANGKR